jgi:hypothetical protein
VDAPLLFDTSLKKKLAYWAVVDPLQLPGADLSASMTAAPAVVPAGQAGAFTITVRNNRDTDTETFKPTDDDLPAANVAMVMAVPARTVFQSVAAPGGWSCTTPPVGGSGQVRCTAASLAAGAQATFTVTVALVDCATPNASTILGSASVTSTTADPDPAPNNSATAGFQVANPPPIITPAGALDMTLECRASFVDPGATAADMCDGPVPVVSSSNVDPNHVGTYAVVYDAVDRAGSHAAPVVRTVRVADTTVPTLDPVGPFVLAPPNHVYQTFTIADLVAGAADSCDTSLGAGAVVITQVTSDEPDSGGGSGSTTPDIVIAGDCRSAQLRVERTGTSNGRVYTVWLRVQDASGNRTVKSVRVFVPHDPDGTTVDNGVNYTVTSGCP